MYRLISPLLLLCLAPLVAADAPAEKTLRTPTETARGLFETKHYPEARSMFEKIAAAEPDNAEAHFHLGVLAQLAGNADDAVRELELATALAPKNSNYALELGGAYGLAAEKASLLSKMGWARKAGAALQKAVELDPENLAARNGLITFYRQAPSFLGGSLPKAYEQAEEIRKRDPLVGAAVLGQLYLADHKHDEAFALYEEALKVAPDNYALLYGIGRAAAQTGKHLEEGAKALRRCLELTPLPGDPGLAPVQWRLGNIAEKRGDIAAARSAYEAAVKIDPAFHQAAEALAKLR